MGIDGTISLSAMGGLAKVDVFPLGGDGDQCGHFCRGDTIRGQRDGSRGERDGRHRGERHGPQWRSLATWRSPGTLR